MRSISSPAINLAMSARDMQVIDSKNVKMSTSTAKPT